MKIDEKHLDIVGGFYCTLVLTKKYELYKTGYIHNEGTVNIPIKIGFPKGERILKVSVGGCNALCVGSSGKIYGLGKNDEAQVSGRGKEFLSYNTFEKPKVISCFNDKDIIDVVCEDRHSLLLSRDGTAYGVGYRDYLGCSGKTAKREGYFILKHDIVQIEVGRYITFLFGSDGTCWGAGNNEYQQLGTNISRSVTKKSIVRSEEIKNLLKEYIIAPSKWLFSPFKTNNYIDIKIVTFAI